VIPTKLAIVIPVFNEAESLNPFWNELNLVLDNLLATHEVIFVNDGSTDESLKILMGFQAHNVKVVNLLVNAGHMAALDAGYRVADAKWIVSMDADLQHPPSVIPKLLEIAEGSNVDVIYAVRSSRSEDSFVKRFTAKMYYRTLKGFSGIPIHENAADFRLISDRVLSVIKTLPPRSHVFRLLIPKLGFSYTTFEFTASKRIAGESKYGFRQMIGLALRSVVSFSTRPLMISVYLGTLFSFLSVSGLIYSVIQFFRGDTVPGWASVSSGLFLLFGILFFLLGITGTYLAEIWRRTSGIPDYFVDINSYKSEDFMQNGES
jgi:glycosyltransferase involved in cell wall biosynthesis